MGRKKNFWNYFLIGFLITSIKIIISAPGTGGLETLLYTYLNNLITATIAGFGAMSGIDFYLFIKKKRNDKPHNRRYSYRMCSN